MGRLVIEDVDDALMRDLAHLAAENRMEREMQAKRLLRRAIPTSDRAPLAARLDAIAALTLNGSASVDSLDLLREDRRR